LEHLEDWSEAARVLQAIPLDSGHRVVSPEYKCRIYIHIVQLYLEDEDAVSAEAYLNRASLLIHDITNLELKNRFRACQARKLDFQRQFLASASKYLELSYSQEISKENRQDCLFDAIICTILAPAGPLRSRMLNTLYKDNRTRESPEFERGGTYQMLEKMYTGRVCLPNQVEAFRQILKPHQNAQLGSNQTVLDRAMMEHNLLAASKIYNNITFDELGNLLSISSERAEKVAASMITENRLKGHIDQVDSLVYFDSQNSLLAWDAQIANFCNQLNQVLENIEMSYLVLN
jgi:COP9 signalosome complex subunit 4